VKAVAFIVLLTKHYSASAKNDNFNSICSRLQCLWMRSHFFSHQFEVLGNIGAFGKIALVCGFIKEAARIIKFL